MSRRVAAYLTRLADERGEAYIDDVEFEPPLVDLLSRRGWAGWTKLERFATEP
jgi:hypothetical protein